VRNEPENQTVNDLYGVQRRLELVSRRLRESKEITQRNKELIFRFTDNCSLRGLSKLRVLFYLNRFWNIARLAGKDFDKMDREDIEELVGKLQMRGFEPRTISDHLTAIKTFWKWLERCEDAYPEKVRWIKPWRSNKTRKLPEQFLTKEDVEKLVNAAVNPRGKALISILASIFRSSGLSSLGAGSTNSSVDDFPTMNRPSSTVFCSITVSHFRTRPLYFIPALNVSRILPMNRCLASNSKRYR